MDYEEFLSSTETVSILYWLLYMTPLSKRLHLWEDWLFLRSFSFYVLIKVIIIMQPNLLAIG